MCSTRLAHPLGLSLYVQVSEDRSEALPGPRSGAIDTEGLKLAFSDHDLEISVIFACLIIVEGLHET